VVQTPVLTTVAAPLKVDTIAPLEEALLGHTWTWVNPDDHGAPMTVQFFPNGSVSGGWNWQWYRRPTGEIIVDCYWGTSRHMYLAFNKELTEFGAYGEHGNSARGRCAQAVSHPGPAHVAIVGAPKPAESVVVRAPVVAVKAPVVSVMPVKQQPQAPVKQVAQNPPAHKAVATVHAKPVVHTPAKPASGSGTTKQLPTM
jgi:hypothetical protein